MLVRPGLVLILTLVLPWLACQQVEQDYAPYPSLDTSPSPGPAGPPEGTLAEASRLMQDGDAKEVAKILGKFEPVTPLEKAWQRLLLGEAWLMLGVQDKALRLLLANYEELRDARPAPDPAISRVLARSLKKLGAFYRERNDFEKAYALHELQWLYMRRLGDLGERHDALISLDGDAAALRNYFASEQWLRESLLIAQQMPEGMDKQKALLISWNNMAVTLQELLRFPEAEAAIKESRRIGRFYDTKATPAEFREIQALAQYADVMGAWAQFTEIGQPIEARPLYAKSQGLAREALALAEQQGLQGNDRVALEHRMRKHCGHACRNTPVEPGTSPAP